MQLHMLPMHDLPIRGDEAEVPPAVVQLDELTYASWGPPLSLPQYLARERRMRALPFSRGLRSWVLRDGETGLASCESYAVPIVVGGPRAKTPRRGVVHGIASVFVEPKLRGHGHARALLTRVHAHLAGEGVLGCYLMSEIGPTLYAGMGYVARPLRLCRYAAAAQAERPPSPLPWSWLQKDALAGLLKERYRLPAPALRIETTPEQLGWHLGRSDFYAQALSRKSTPHIGARSGDAFAVWQPSYPKDLLRVLMLYPGEQVLAPGAAINPRSPELEAVRHVLHAARFTAAELGLTHVEVWENAGNGAYLRGGVRLAADDVPMLLPLTPELRGDDWTDYERCHWL